MKSDQSVGTSRVKRSWQLLKGPFNTGNLPLADDSKHNCRSRKVKERVCVCVCSDNTISVDFSSLMYSWGCKAGKDSSLSSSLILMPCGSPEMAFGFLKELS